jgi:integrase
MARTIRSNALETRSARLKLPIAKKPVFVKIGDGIGLGYRRNATAGTWVARLANGRGGNSTKAIGTADDYEDANGRGVLGYWQAADAARRLGKGDAGEATAIVTLADALDRYEADLKTRGGDLLNVTRVRKHITGALAKKAIALLSSAELRSWRDNLAKTIVPASVNRTCRGLKAALNLAADTDDRLSRRAWTIGLALIPNAETSKNVILPEPVVAGIVAAARGISPEFGLLAEGLAITGARFSQITRVEICDLLGEGDAARLNVPVSRKGRGTKQVRSHPIPIGPQLAARLRVAAGDRPVTEPLLLKPNGRPWRHSDERKLFRRAVTAAGQDPDAVSAYALRHTWIVRQLLAGVPARLVATMADTSILMLERTYSRYIDAHGDALIRAALPNVELADADVIPLRA